MKEEIFEGVANDNSNNNPNVEEVMKENARLKSENEDLKKKYK